MIYEYKCTTCLHEFEATRKMDDRDKPIDCPECEAKNARRLISAPAFKTGGGGHPGNPIK